MKDPVYTYFSSVHILSNRNSIIKNLPSLVSDIFSVWSTKCNWVLFTSFWFSSSSRRVAAVAGFHGNSAKFKATVCGKVGYCSVQHGMQHALWPLFQFSDLYDSTLLMSFSVHAHSNSIFDKIYERLIRDVNIYYLLFIAKSLPFISFFKW